MIEFPSLFYFIFWISFFLLFNLLDCFCSCLFYLSISIYHHSPHTHFPSHLSFYEIPNRSSLFDTFTIFILSVIFRLLICNLLFLYFHQIKDYVNSLQFLSFCHSAHSKWPPSLRISLLKQGTSNLILFSYLHFLLISSNNPDITMSHFSLWNNSTCNSGL